VRVFLVAGVSMQRHGRAPLNSPIGRSAQLAALAYMSDSESPATRYRRLAQECLEVAQTFPLGERRTVLLQMA
jgi:hypothetical protein